MKTRLNFESRWQRTSAKYKGKTHGYIFKRSIGDPESKYLLCLWRCMFWTQKYNKVFWQLRCALLKKARTLRSSSLGVTSVTLKIANRPIVLRNDELHPLLKHPVFLWKDYTSLEEFHGPHLANSVIWDLKCFDLYSQIKEVGFQSHDFGAAELKSQWRSWMVEESCMWRV